MTVQKFQWSDLLNEVQSNWKFYAFLGRNKFEVQRNFIANTLLILQHFSRSVFHICFLTSKKEDKKKDFFDVKKVTTIAWDLSWQLCLWEMLLGRIRIEISWSLTSRTIQLSWAQFLLSNRQRMLPENWQLFTTIRLILFGVQTQTSYLEFQCTCIGIYKLFTMFVNAEMYSESRPQFWTISRKKLHLRYFSRVLNIPLKCLYLLQSDERSTSFTVSLTTSFPLPSIVYVQVVPWYPFG